MPINYAVNFEKEFVDWDDLFEFLNQFPLFHNKKIQSKFLNSWKKQIISSEKTSYQNFTNFDFNKEYFPLKILFGTQWLGWSCLLIDKIEEILFNGQESPCKIPTSHFLDEAEHLKGKDFFEPTSKIIYHPSSFGLFSYIPILIFSPHFPFPCSRVIDGNHRVKTAISENHPDISGYLLTEGFFFNHPEIFADEFSRTIFLFCYDLSNFVHKNYFSDRFLPLRFNKKIERESTLFQLLEISWLQ